MRNETAELRRQRQRRQLTELRSELRTKAGVEPSLHWLIDCWDALSSCASYSTTETIAADECLYQILHHDLRDVIRTFSDEEEITSPLPRPAQQPSCHIAPPLLLRQAIRESLRKDNTNNHDRKAILPSSFRLLVQMEEFLDVSLNATSRLEVGPASANGPSSTGCQATRCLKLAFSDGYHPITGLAHYPSFEEEDQQQSDNGPTPAPTTIMMTTPGAAVAPSSSQCSAVVLVAMEVVVIPQLSSNSRAGLKVLLHGPITVRHGVLLLHPGNALVLGGHVPELVQLQQQALEQAKRLAGVGVDPTIRALIGTQHQELDDDENDTGEHGTDRPREQPSRDLDSALPRDRTATATVTTALRSGAMAAPVPIPSPAIRSTSSSALVVNPPPVGQRNPHYPPQQPAITARTSLAIRSPYPVSSRTTSQRQQQPQGNQPSTATTIPVDVEMIILDDDDDDNDISHRGGTTNLSTGLSFQASSSSFSSRDRTTTTRNPYATTNTLAIGHQTISSQSPILRHNNNTQATTHSNPYATASNRSDTTGKPNNSLPRIATPSTTSTSAPATTATATRVLIPISSSATPAVIETGRTTTTTSAPGNVAHISAPSGPQPLVLSFEELRLLMVRLRDNPILYQQYLGRTFVSSLRQIGLRVEFNIVKSKPVTTADAKEPPSGGKKKKDKHYEYWLICRFGGPSSSTLPTIHDANTTTASSSVTTTTPLLLTCQVSSALQEPYFGLTPKEMRELAKTNGAEAQRLVKQGGEDLTSNFAQCQPYELVLVEYRNSEGEDDDNPFPREVDGVQPILILTKKCAEQKR